MSIISDLKLIEKNRKAEKIFSSLFEDKDFRDIEYNTPSEYVKTYWDAYKRTCIENIANNNAVNGKIFELIINTLFIREGLLPIYIQAKAAFIPNVEYDMLIYTNQFGPLCFSLKTSLRERKKQADLEAIALKYVHRKAKCWLISMEENEVEKSKEDLKEGALLGINDVILASSKDFDNLIAELKTYTICEAGKVEIISSNKIISKELVSKYGTVRK